MSALIEPTPKLLNILFACANSRLPWGVDWDNFIPLCETTNDNGEPVQAYILCCGHTIEYGPESYAVVGAGLMLPGPLDRFGRRTLTITKTGRAFLDHNRSMVQFDA